MAGIVQYVAKPSPQQTRIVETLRQRIIAGELAPGAPLPSVAKLRDSFNTSCVTIQRAIVYLRDSGYITTTPRGSYVSETPSHLCRSTIVGIKSSNSALISCLRFSE